MNEKSLSKLLNHVLLKKYPDLDSIIVRFIDLDRNMFVIETTVVAKSDVDSRSRIFKEFGQIREDIKNLASIMELSVAHIFLSASDN